MVSLIGESGANISRLPILTLRLMLNVQKIISTNASVSAMFGATWYNNGQLAAEESMTAILHGRNTP